MNGSNMWFYDPSFQGQASAISPQQRLMGQASDGDVVTGQPSPRIRGKAPRRGDAAGRRPQGPGLLALGLDRRSPEAIYAVSNIGSKKAPNRPVKGKFYSIAGGLLKIAYYTNMPEQAWRHARERKPSSSIRSIRIW